MFDAVSEMLAGSPHLHLRHRVGKGPCVLYIHGATFPCALAIGYRFADGRSWEDALAEAGFDVWGLDFAGYGGSERPASLRFGDAEDAVGQIARTIAYIRAVRGGARVNIVAHSWGTIPASMAAARDPEAIERLALFGPILLRDGVEDAAPAAAWRLITVEEQRQRFDRDTPAGVSSILAEPDLRRWGEVWLATDPSAATRTPHAVCVPTGPQRDIAAIWSSRALYDPAAIAAPTLIVRGAWDSLCTDADVARFITASGNRPRMDVKLPDGGHLMHLEIGRERLWRVVNTFIDGGLA